MMVWYLLWLYDSMGGDPDALNHESLAECMGGVSDYYTKHGVPTGMSDGLRANFRFVIEALSDLVATAPSGLIPPHLAAYFVEMLRDMYSDVGGDPDSLV